MPLESSAWKYSVRGDVIAFDASHPTGTAPFARRSLRKFTGDTPLARCLKDIATIIRRDYRRAFQEGGPGWSPLKPATVKKKTGMGLPPKGKGGRTLPRLRQINASGANAILIGKGTLRDSYGVKGAAGHVEDIDVKEGTVTVGSAIEYAGVHQKGAMIGRRRSTGVGNLAMVKKALRAHKMGPHRSAIKTSGGGYIPARPVIISGAARRLIRDRVAQYLAEVAKENG